VTIAGLLTCHAEPPQSRDTESVEGVRRQSAYVVINPPIEGGRGSQRHLLLENDPDQGWKAGTAAPERRVAQASMKAREVGITRGQRARGFSE
jgi:hypothetical protein